MKQYLLTGAVILSAVISPAFAQDIWQQLTGSLAQSWAATQVSIADTITQPFMTIPLSRQWLDKHKISYEISEWRVYSTGEQVIHWLVNHRSIDYAVPYGTPVYAPTDGRIQASYYNTTLWAVGKRVIYDGKTINYGLWYRVQIIHPDPQDPLNPDKVTFVQLAHLSRFAPRVAKTISWLPYIYDAVEDAVKIDNYSLTSQNLKLILKGMNLRRAIYVKRWDLIWYAGDSWLERGEEIDTSYKPKMYIKNPHNSRDEPHIHLQLYNRLPSGSKKPWSTKDPYNLWTGATWPQYPTHDNWLVLTPWHLFKSTDGKLPDYAK
jgi:hypothetical protein